MTSFRRPNGDSCEDAGRHDQFAAMRVPQRAREILNRHPYFCGRADGFEFEWVENVLVVRGRVPTFYLKQLLQNALKKLDGVQQIDNCVDVVRPELRDDEISFATEQLQVSCSCMGL